MGWKALTASRSSTNRKRFSAVLVSSNLKPCTHWPGGVVSARSRSAVWMADMDGRSQSAAITCRMPLFSTWMWASMNPGSTVLPVRSITFTPGPMNVSTSRLLPTPTMRPSLIATACARGRLRSMVMTLAFLITVSALVDIVDMTAPAVSISWPVVEDASIQPSIIKVDRRGVGFYICSPPAPPAILGEAPLCPSPEGRGDLRRTR